MGAISRIGRQAKSWDLWLGLVVGVLAFVLALKSHAVRQNAVPILLAEAAIGVALTSAVFAGLAVFATFFDGAYRKVLELAGGLDEAIQPYVVVVCVAGGSAIVGTLSALALPSTGRTMASVCIGVSTWVCVWSIAGVAHLADITRFHASARADLMAGVDKAEALRKRRLRERSRPRATTGQ